MEIQVRTEKAEDINAIFNLNTSAFESKNEAKLINNLRASGSMALSLVALKDKEIVGQITFSPMHIETEQGLNLMGLGPMAVTPLLQKSGIGKKLVYLGLSKLKENGVDAVFVLGHQDYYPKFGFKPSLTTYRIKSTYDVPDNVFMCLELQKGCLKDVSGTVCYSKEFDSV